MKYFLFLFLTLLCGCASQFYKQAEGVDISLGLSIPNEETLQLEILNYLSGSKVKVSQPSLVHNKTTFTATNEYFWGMVKINETRTIDVFTQPTNNLENANGQ